MTAYRTLIVDDEPDIRELLEITLGRMGIDTIAAPDLATARRLIGESSFDLCLTDLNLPDGHGLDLVRFIAAEQPGLPVAVITAYGSMDLAINALKAGAFDFVQKPVDLEQLRTLVGSALRVRTAQAASADTRTRMIGDSAPMQALREQIAKLARSQAPVYISGESGSGKELAARLIHELSPRSDGPFVPVNCGAIPGELMESEFFGHIRGSFTGAVADKEGLFQAARGGTLFLDEVADLPLSMQVKLLRAIQEKAVRPVGAAAEQPIDVRILSATHKNLGREVTEGRFRQDLFYRLNVIELQMPSLRQRPGDIPLLAAHILERLAGNYGIAAPTLGREALEALSRYHFPGNVRELENMLERAVTLSEHGVIQAGDLRLEPPPKIAIEPLAASEPASPGSAGIVVPSDGHPTVPHTEHTGAMTAAAPESKATAGRSVGLADLPPGASLEDFLDTIERGVITEALEAARWNKTAAARRLGITFRALRYRLKKLGLE
jgi:two-component system response regulator PilR (NtrC family)